MTDRITTSSSKKLDALLRAKEILIRLAPTSKGHNKKEKRTMSESQR